VSVYRDADIGSTIALPKAGTRLENRYVFDASAREIKALAARRLVEIVSEHYNAHRKFEARRPECAVQRSAASVRWAVLDDHQESLATGRFLAAQPALLTLSAARRSPPEGRHVAAGPRRYAPDRAIATQCSARDSPRSPPREPCVQAIGRQPQRAPDGVPIHYERNRPENTTLNRLLQQHAASFIAHIEASTTAELPRSIKDEFDAFLKCGIHGTWASEIQAKISATRVHVQ
jgi:hypothetical protein